MQEQSNLPEYVHPIDRKEVFHFSCHPDIVCFTHCCRLLELNLMPYDVLRLRYATGLHSRELLSKYIIREQNPGEPFPRFYLTMVDDGRASCVFVNEKGCQVYGHRPAACRTYPLGRAVVRRDDHLIEHFVLLKEQHCSGFAEQTPLTPIQYIEEQELQKYYELNDLLADILQHRSLREGYVPSAAQQELFELVLYDLDSFREQLPSFESEIQATEYKLSLLNEDDEELLRFGIHLLTKRVFLLF